MKKTTLIIRGQPAPQGGSHHGWHHPTRPVVIRNMQRRPPACVMKVVKEKV